MTQPTYDQVLDLLRAAPKGAARAQIVDQYRSVVLNTGAGVHLYATNLILSSCHPDQNDNLSAPRNARDQGGKLESRGGISTCAERSKFIQDQLNQTYVGVLERQSSKTGRPDGWGVLGGMSELAAPVDLAANNPRLLDEKDNVIRHPDGTLALTADLATIRLNNVAREAREELGNLGITDYRVPRDKLEFVDMPGVRDDNFIINRWDGHGKAWAATPYVHLLRVDETLLDDLQTRSHANAHEKNAEAKSYLKIPLFTALAHWGKRGGDFTSNDGRDMTSDYRYPHEFAAVWFLASKLLGHNDNRMIDLAHAVQSSADHFVDFTDVAGQMNITLDALANIWKIKPATVPLMVQEMNRMKGKTRS